MRKIGWPRTWKIQPLSRTSALLSDNMRSLSRVRSFTMPPSALNAQQAAFGDMLLRLRLAFGAPTPGPFSPACGIDLEPSIRAR